MRKGGEQSPPLSYADDYYGAWDVDRIVVVASGPSLTREDVKRIRGERVIVVNTTVKMIPWADVLYACDLKWWEHNENLWRDFQGLKVTWAKPAAAKFNILYAYGKKEKGLGRDSLHTGGGSGHMAVNLAYLLATERLKQIVLLGFDMQYKDGQPHWHGRHRRTSNPSENALKKWADRMVEMYKDLDSLGIDLINCTRESALTIPRKPLEDVL